MRSIRSICLPAIVTFVAFVCPANAMDESSFGPEQILGVSLSFNHSDPALLRGDDGVLHLIQTSQTIESSRFSPVYRYSEDGGLTWSAPIYVADTTSVSSSRSTRPIVQDDTVYVVWANASSTNELGIRLARRVNDEEGFVEVSAPLDSVPDLPVLIDFLRTGQDRFVCYYVRYNSGVTGFQHYTVSTNDGGETWHDPVRLDAANDSQVLAPIGSMAVSTDGVLHAVFTGQDRVIRCYTSTNDGQTWASSAVDTTSTTASSGIAVRSDGSVGVASSVPAPGGREVLFRKSVDGCSTWTSPIVVSGGGPIGVYNAPMLAAGADGKWHANMTWTDPFGFPIAIYYATSANGEDWSDPIPLTQNYPATATLRAFESDPGGGVHAAWTWQRQSPDFEVRVVYRSNAEFDTIGDNILLPDDRVLLRPAQNPSRDLPAVLRYQLVERGEVDVFVWDAQGRSIRRWSIGSVDVGEHRHEWNGKTEDGREAANGVYYWELRVVTADGVRRARASVVPREVSRGSDSDGCAIAISAGGDSD